MVLLVVIGVTAALTLSIANKDSGDSGSSQSASRLPSVSGTASADVASANDTGPVSVITEDPSCAAQQPILDTYARASQNGWQDRDPNIPRSDWTSEVRAQYDEASQAMKNAADQLVPVAKLTPHRVMRELYEQFIAYARAYVSAVPNYAPIDDNMAIAANAMGDAITFICASIENGAASARGPLVEKIPSESFISSDIDIENPSRFLLKANPACLILNSVLSSFQVDTSAWLGTDPGIPASDWSPQQRELNEQVAPVMRRFATQLRSVGRQSDNTVFRDFAYLSAQYRNAYVLAIPSYVPADQYLARASLRLAGALSAACSAVGA
ncbi:hypothetical protein [Mycolicibacterium goodii]|uniref:hypothetical protein n=1 Tax=Mycolicibacterium goodii TaxID=134601 RepID=UPI001BDC9416|nr:hypothetical protein [Mycolicibacterium goodii]MBU8818859.1 hypothetical protein [Mycolicibacterium goodii]MBU8828498.1 hypothetical protein [Mycolicibacterium goodii]